MKILFHKNLLNCKYRLLLSKLLLMQIIYGRNEVTKIS
jgi:hypothetical protein